jgi:hypothetical protein
LFTELLEPGLGRYHSIGDNFIKISFMTFIIRAMKSRTVRWTGHAARMGRRDVYKVFVGKSEIRHFFEDI